MDKFRGTRTFIGLWVVMSSIIAFKLWRSDRHIQNYFDNGFRSRAAQLAHANHTAHDELLKPSPDYAHVCKVLKAAQDKWNEDYDSEMESLRSMPWI